jgi:hypothetical protein
LPPSTAPGSQPQHTGKERHVHSPTLQREHLQGWTPGKGRGHTPQHDPQPYCYTEEAHEAIPAWRLAAHQADHESRHQEAGAAREEPPRTRGKPWGIAPEHAPHADTPQTAEAVLALPLLAHHPNQQYGDHHKASVKVIKDEHGIGRIAPGSKGPEDLCAIRGEHVHPDVQHDPEIGPEYQAPVGVLAEEPPQQERAEEGETGTPQERMGHPPVVHEAEDGAAEREEKIQIRQFGPHYQRHRRRRTVSLLEARLGQQRPSQAMGEIIRHNALSVPPASPCDKTCRSLIILILGQHPCGLQHALDGRR